LDAVIARMKAADQRASKAEGDLKQLRDKDLPEIDKLKRDHEEAVNQVTALKESNNRLAAEVAFLKDNTHTWHDPATALKLVDMSQVVVNEDGTVTGMKDALKALASSHPFLIKQEATQEAPKPAGTSPANNGGSTGAKPSGKGMVARIPALQTRVPRK
jgi:FtsZ-binding cell division protein ZapB